MRHPLLLLSVVLAATRSLAFGVQSPGKPAARPTISADREYEVLLVVTLGLAGLLVLLCVMTSFPDLGAQITEMNKF